MYFKRKLTALLLCTAIVISCTACRVKDDDQSAEPVVSYNQVINAAVIYSGNSQYGSWRNVYEQLSQSLAANMKLTAVSVDEGDWDLTNYDVLYPDISITLSDEGSKIRADILSFVQQGGYLFLENGFNSFFDPAFFGVTEFKKLESLPKEIEFPLLDDELIDIQDAIKDFNDIYKSYYDYEKFAALSYGCAGISDTATVIAGAGDLALYLINQVGEGQVFLTNPLLPNSFTIDGFSMTPSYEGQTYFINTTSSFNQILRNAFISYVSKVKFGYSVERVFGSFGRPSIAWQLHYEDITGIKNNALITFSEMCKEYLQVPSFNIIRSPYWWYQRVESITYVINDIGDGDGFLYDIVPGENNYTAGMHIAEDDQWLTQTWLEDEVSFFDQSVSYNHRAYPYIADLTSDNIPDILSGSSDGKIYYYKGVSCEERFKVSEKKALTDRKDEEISVPGHSAPIWYDIDGDGRRDLISGGGDGNIYWFKGSGELHFEPRGILLETGFGEVQTFPDIGDIDNDGEPEIVVGTNSGMLQIYSLSDAMPPDSWSLTGDLSDEVSRLGRWIAPRLIDLDGDGTQDIVIGTADGYIAKMLGHDNTFSFNGFFQGTETNYKGNLNLKFGNNAVPFFYDLNRDGKLDLIVGQMEYGMAYSIDSEYFPFRSRLEEQIDYINKNGFYMGAHMYTHEYASSKYELDEFRRQKAAMEDYGIKTEGIGVNLHTWYSSGLSPTQSYFNQFDSGMLWNSGAKTPDNKKQVSAETALNIPFYLMRDNEPSIMLLNASTLLYDDGQWSSVAAKYDLPMSIYYHCDMIYKNKKSHEEKVKQVSEFAEKFDYSFVMENQLVKAAAAAYNVGANVTRTGEGGLDISISPLYNEKNSELVEKAYENSIGLKLSFAKDTDVGNIKTDADVWKFIDNCLYIGLNKEVHVYADTAEHDAGTVEGGESIEYELAPHITRINLPAEIKMTESGARVTFREGGMMQIAVSGTVSTTGSGWIVTSSGEDTVFTKYGEADSIVLSYETVQPAANIAGDGDAEQ